MIAIVPTADRQKATVKVRIGFRERDERVLRDMGVKVAFLGSEQPREDEQAPTIYIGREALNADGDGNFVWIVRDDTVMRRAVTIGPASARGQQIMAGLSPGDRVVTSAAAALAPGQPVRITN